MAEYRNFIGYVQFDVNDREVGSQKVRDFVIQPVGTGGGSLRVTLWPEFAGAKVEKGDSVHVQGKFSMNTSNGKTYANLSCTDLTVNGVRQEKASEEIDNPVEEEDEDFDPGF